MKKKKVDLKSMTLQEKNAYLNNNWATRKPPRKAATGFSSAHPWRETRKEIPTK